MYNLNSVLQSKLAIEAFSMLHISYNYMQNYTQLIMLLTGNYIYYGNFTSQYRIILFCLNFIQDYKQL